MRGLERVDRQYRKKKRRTRMVQLDGLTTQYFCFALFPNSPPKPYTLHPTPYTVPGIFFFRCFISILEAPDMHRTLDSYEDLDRHAVRPD